MNKVTLDGKPPKDRINLQLNFKYGRPISAHYKLNNGNTSSLDGYIYGKGYLKKTNEYFCITGDYSANFSRFCTLKANQLDASTHWTARSLTEFNQTAAIDAIIRNDEVYILTVDGKIYKLNSDYKTVTFINKIPTQFSCSYLQTSFNYIEKEDTAYIFYSLSSDKAPLKYDFKKNVFTTINTNDGFGDKRFTTVKNDKIYTLQGNSLLCFSEGVYTKIPINLSFEYGSRISVFKDRLIIFGGTEYKKTYNLYLGNENNTKFELIAILPVYCNQNTQTFMINNGRTILILEALDVQRDLRCNYEISPSYEVIE